MQAKEINFDGIVGPTHNYSGLSYGNIASTDNKFVMSNPKEAAMQGLKKMKLLADLGILQGVMPPHERPHIPTLRTLGFKGSDKQILAAAMQTDPSLLYNCSSASSMWTANAATVSPSADSRDGRVHFTPANLVHKLHRSLEPAVTSAILKGIFHDERFFAHHSHLPSGEYFGDEGAANHTRFCKDFCKQGIQLFAFGKMATKQSKLPRIYPARQTLEASEAIIRLHQLNPSSVLLAQQNPKAIDAGVFHNDVISVGHKNVFLYHAEAFSDTKAVIAELSTKMNLICKIDLIPICISKKEISIEEAVKSYLFNSQLLSLPDGSMLLLAPMECHDNIKVKRCVDEILQRLDNPINRVEYVNLRESMRNGGGPACLRLRVELTSKELGGVNPHVLLDAQLYANLETWINKHYRDRLSSNDLSDPSLLQEGRTALDELTCILQLGSIYDFQK